MANATIQNNKRFIGKLQEIIVYDDDKSGTADRDDINTNLKTFWGTP